MNGHHRYHSYTFKSYFWGWDMKTILYSFFIGLFSLMLVSCGGSGSGSIESETGFITVSIGDNAIDEFDQAIFQISEVRLLGENDQIVLLDEQRTIDFLALETVNEVLAEAEVPAGQYSKIRLAVDSIELIKLDDNGNVEETVDVRLVANGKVDIVPRGEFTVGANSTLALDIDVDLGKSIKLTLTGNGRYIFRPVIFADIIHDAGDGRLVRIEGEFEAIELEGVRQDDRFRLCAPELMSDDDDVEETQSCRLILANGETGLFEVDESLTPSVLGNFQNGDNVVAYGFLQPLAYEHDSDAHYGTPVAALVVAKGEFRYLEGEATSVFEEVEQTFGLVLNPGQGIVGDLQLTTRLPLIDGALLIDSNGNIVEASVIEPGLEVEVEGLLLLDTPNSFEAFIALVDAEQNQVTVTGMATEINLISRTLTLFDGVDSYCVEINDETNMQTVDTLEGAVSLDSISLEALLNAEIEVTGTVNVDTDCLVADSIVLDVSPIL